MAGRISIFPELGVYVVWWIWAISWIAASFWAGRTINRPETATQILYRVITLGGFVGGGHGHAVGGFEFPGPALLSIPLWSASDALGWSMVALAIAGFSFAWWARIHLGRLWSGFVTRKEGHRVVDTGPYRLVRHPIYTGIDAAALALLVVKATPVAIAGFVLIVWGYWIKARIEERFLRQELGESSYDAYALRTPMLVPFFRL
jgi:protein-S-isoprenylcysteine O-methyltransferase Ste14